MKVIIADDATGANDAAVKAFLSGERVRVSCFGGVYPQTTGVLVINAGIRNVPGDKAYAETLRLIDELRLPAGDLFIKVDSTLRGNIAAETDALLLRYPESPVFFAPAYPALGRTVKNGGLFVNGVPADETEFAKDALKPVKSARLSDAVKRDCVVVRGSCGQDAGDMIERAIKDGARVFAFDAEDESGLESAAALKARFPDAIYIGSAGIAGHIWPACESAAASPEPPSPDPSIPSLRRSCRSIRSRSCRRARNYRLCIRRDALCTAPMSSRTYRGIPSADLRGELQIHRTKDCRRRRQFYGKCP